MLIMGDERILGSGDFVESVLQNAGEQIEKRTLAQRKGIGLDILIGKVADHFGLEPADLRSPGRQRLLARARALICALAADRLGDSGRVVSRRLNLSASAVSKLTQRGRTDALNEKLAAVIFRNSG
jgi:putative transposase